jgi:hypothetical protein
MYPIPSAVEERMEATPVRIICTPQEPDNHPAVILAALKDGRIEPGKRYAGWVTENDDVYPFILWPDGRVDYGAYGAEHERNIRTNLMDIAIEVGVTFLINQAIEYKITQVDPL